MADRRFRVTELVAVCAHPVLAGVEFDPTGRVTDAEFTFGAELGEADVPGLDAAVASVLAAIRTGVTAPILHVAALAAGNDLTAALAWQVARIEDECAEVARMAHGLTKQRAAVVPA